MSRMSLPPCLLLLFAAALSFPAVADAQPSGPSANRTALQNHVDFFDRDGDGFIRVHETTQGLMAIGLPGGIVAAKAAALAIHAGLPKTHGNEGGGAWSNFWDPDSALTIDTSIIHKGIHGSDTGTYQDADGEYVDAKFKAIFQYDVNGNDALSSLELVAFHAGNRTGDGLAASIAEFTILMTVAGEWNPRLLQMEISKETLVALYDGTLFYKLEAKVKARREAARRRAEAARWEWARRIKRGFLDWLN